MRAVFRRLRLGPGSGGLPLTEAWPTSYRWNKSVDVSELAALVGETPASLAEVEYVFRALVGYPDEAGGIAGASTENLSESLQRCCNALITADDQSELPNALWQRIANRVGQKTPAPGGTYASAAALVIADQPRWEEIFGKYGGSNPGSP